MAFARELQSNLAETDKKGGLDGRLFAHPAFDGALVQPWPEAAAATSAAKSASCFSTPSPST
jgi:hypothetical protein